MYLSFCLTSGVELEKAETTSTSTNSRTTASSPLRYLSPVIRFLTPFLVSFYLIYSVSPFNTNVVSSVMVSPVKTKTSFPSFVSSTIRYSPSFFTTSTLYFEFFSSSVVGITSASVTPVNSTAFEKSLSLTI